MNPIIPKFSLIVATYGRYAELAEFLQSVGQQTLELSDIEVIVVDQNTQLDLCSILEQYRDILVIKHIKSTTKGLSYNRNLGIAQAKGQIMAFPDDDCRYYPDTLEAVSHAFEQNPKTKLILGRIFDRATGKSVIRSWPKEAKAISKFNFLTYYSSITIFAKQPVDFDERLGAGTYFGSYEDADFVYRFLAKFGNALYEPNIEVWHSEQNLHVFPEQKVIQYGLGFGALARKHWSLLFAYFLSGVLAFHAFSWLRAMVRQDKLEMRKRRFAITSRIQGFMRFPDSGAA